MNLWPAAWTLCLAGKEVKRREFVSGRMETEAARLSAVNITSRHTRTQPIGCSVSRVRKSDRQIKAGQTARTRQSGMAHPTFFMLLSLVSKMRPSLSGELQILTASGMEVARAMFSASSNMSILAK